MAQARIAGVSTKSLLFKDNCDLRVVLATVVVALPGIGHVEGHRFVAAGQGAAFGSAVLREEARHCCQLQEKGVGGAFKAWSGYD